MRISSLSIFLLYIKHSAGADDRDEGHYRDTEARLGNGRQVHDSKAEEGEEEQRTDQEQLFPPHVNDPDHTCTVHQRHHEQLEQHKQDGYGARALKKAIKYLIAFRDRVIALSPVPEEDLEISAGWLQEKIAHLDGLLL